jgi:predicted enzyme related to lactoylglutathione lyase
MPDVGWGLVDGVRGVWMCTPDLDLSAQFYAGLTAGGESVRERDVRRATRVSFLPFEGPASWLVVFGVARIDDVVERCLSGGAQITGTHNDLAVVEMTDARGVRFGLMGHDAAPSCDDLRVGDVILADLYTRDVDRAQDFYTAALNLNVDVLVDDPVDYVQLSSGARHVMGILEMTSFLPSGTPEHWMPYLRFDHVELGIARATSLGALVVVPSTPSPTGTYAIVKDPLGCLVGLWDGASLTTSGRSGPAIVGPRR